MAEDPKTIVLLASDRVGAGDDELGAVLMRSFVKTLAARPALPHAIVCVNHGVRLTCEGSPLLEDLAGLAAHGVKVLSCGTCLDWLHLKEALRAGEPTNMATIVELLATADRVLRP